MKIGIVTDSASDITQQEAEVFGIRVVPMTTNIGEEEFLDGVTISKREFFEKIIETDAAPTTSQIPPFRFEESFEEALKENDYVVCIALSSKLSGTYQSACIAAGEFEGKVLVVDSENVALGQRILVEMAMSALRENPDMTPEELVGLLNEEKKKIVVVALLDTLEYLKRGGRISATEAFVASTLSIKPVIGVEEGAIKVLGKARGSKNGNNLLSETVQKKGDIDADKPICLAYSGISDALLQKYYQDNKDLYQIDESKLIVSVIGSTIGSHVGPGAIAVSFFRK